jgi:NadR type nicotinamide-nucleotide adenylyltransferase
MLKIALVGPESTGKSELSVALADFFKGEFVPEFARTYIEQLDRDYTMDDVCNIARKQIEEQDVCTQSDSLKPVFFDTELIITKVWFEYCYQQVPYFVAKRMSKNYFDFYLLCYPDLPWVPDTVREHGGDERMFFYEWYKREIEKTGIPYAIIQGVGNERTENAIKAIMHINS